MAPRSVVRFALAIAWLGNAAVVFAQSHLGTAVPSVAFVNVTVVPMDAERMLPHHTVIIEDGVITHVGTVADVRVPDSAVVIDGTGRFLIPGLADMHVHIRSFEELDLLLAHGITLVREMYGFPWHLYVREGIRQGGRSPSLLEE